MTVHRDPFWQAVAALAVVLGSVVLLGLNEQGADCFFSEASCLDNSMLLAGGALALVGAVLVGGWVARRGCERPAEPPPLSWKEGLAAAGAVLLAGVLRLGLRESYPAWLDYDSAQNAWIAITLWEQLPTHGFQPVLLEWATGNESLYIYVVGAALKLLGVSTATLRLPSALVGTATVLAIYLLGRRMFSWQVGVAAGVFAAVCPWHILHSRMATRPVLTPLFVALGAWLLHRALSAESRTGAWIQLVLCGLLLGLGLHGYEAFRLFPLAVAACLLWVRLRQRMLGQGLLELAVVAGCAVLVTLPIFVFALRHPEAYMEHVSANSVFHLVQQTGSLWPVLDNLGTTLSYMLFALPMWPHDLYANVLPLAMMAPLFVAGLAGLVLTRRGDDQAFGVARVLLVVTLVLMTAPFLLTRFSNLTPRRYMGEMVPFYLLAGVAAVGILRGLAQRLRRVLAGVVAVAGLAGLVYAMTGVAGAMTERMPHHVEPRAQQVMRWCMTQVERHEIYLAPDLVGQGYLARFFLKHPRIHQLPTAWPLPRGAPEQELLLVARTEPWARLLKQQFGARLSHVTLDALSEQQPRLKLAIYKVSRQALTRRRVTAKALASGFSAWLLAPQPGVYHFKPPKGVVASLDLNGHKATLSNTGAVFSAPLAAGLHRVIYQPLGGKGVPRWKVPGGTAWDPLPQDALWTLAASAELPVAPRTVTLPDQLGATRYLEVPAFPEFKDHRTLQDLDQVQGRATRYVVDLDRYPVKAWTGGDKIALEPVLFTAPNQPLAHAARYEPGVYKSLSLAVSDAGFFLLDRIKGRITRYDREGVQAEPLGQAPLRPVDLAATSEALYVADPGSRALLECVAPQWTCPPLVQDVVPVAVAVNNGWIGLLDRSRHRLVLRQLADDAGSSAVIVNLGQVNRTMRLALSPAGEALVVDPTHKQLLQFNARGQLLAPRGDPLTLSARFAKGSHGDRPVAAVYSASQITVLGQVRSLVQFQLGGQ